MNCCLKDGYGQVFNIGNFYNYLSFKLGILTNFFGIAYFGDIGMLMRRLRL